MKFALNGRADHRQLTGPMSKCWSTWGGKISAIFEYHGKWRALRKKGYSPREYYEEDEELRQVPSANRHRCLAQTSEGAIGTRWIR